MDEIKNNEIQWETKHRHIHDFSVEPEIIGLFIGDVPSSVGGIDFVLELPSGQQVTLFGKTVLRNQLKSVKPLSLVKIVYRGRKKSAKTNRQYDDFEVFTPKEKVNVVVE